MPEIAPGVLSFVDKVKPAPLASIDARSTVLSLASDGAMIISPLDFSAEQVAEIEALGAPEHIVAPNLFHHFFLRHAMERWPNARVWAPPGLAEKVFELDGVEGILSLASATAAEFWPAGIELHEIEGMPKFREWVFLHHPSNTLVVTDLLFNQPVGHNAFTRLFFRFAGTYRRCAVSRLFSSLIKDEAAFAASCRRVLDWDFERLVMAHGETITDAPNERLRGALERWLSRHPA